MNIKMFLCISIFFVNFVLSYSSNDKFIKLEKTAVSTLPADLVIPDLKSVTLDHKGNVFAFAGKSGGKECFIVKFDENLEFLKRFGRDGKGPGEFSTRANTPENRLSIDTNGDVYVFDANPNRFVIFDNEGNYKKDIQIARNFSKDIGSIYQIKAVGNETFIALQYRWELPPHGLVFTLNPTQIKVRYPFIEKGIRVKFSSLISSYYGNNCIIDTDSKLIVFGNSQIYKFYVYDQNGNLKLKVEDKDRVMGNFNDREAEYIKNTFLTPKIGNSSLQNDFLAQLNADKALFNTVLTKIKKSKNVISDIKISGEKIYVFLVSDDITSEEKWPVEIYNIRGKMVKKGYFGKLPAKIWKNHVFFYDSDEEDNPLILKYKIVDGY